jgi:hypothetical protein
MLASIKLSCEEIVKKRLRDYLDLEDEICLVCCSDERSEEEPPQRDSGAALISGWLTRFVIFTSGLRIG